MDVTLESKLYDPAEVVRLTRQYGKLGAVDVALEIRDAWGTQHSDPQWDYACMLGAIFTAGYIQGKREERLKQAEFILKDN